MTEGEARTKLCYLGPNGPGDLYYVRDGDKVFHCIGSACMAWRWNKGKDNTRQYVDKNGLLIVETGQKGMGYCGLAGK